MLWCELQHSNRSQLDYGIVKHLNYFNIFFLTNIIRQTVLIHTQKMMC